MASAWPVFPDVGSTMVPPGFSSPRRSASSIIRSPIRSFTLPPGFRVSTLARIVGRSPAVIRWSRTSGVCPTASRMLRIDDFEAMLTSNPIWRQRLEGIGVLTRDEAIETGVTGPMLRASGVDYDVRKTFPYCGYEQYDFQVALARNGDCYDRYRVRVREMRESLKILQQALDRLPGGAWLTSDRKVALPPRAELSKSMEAVIHHFRLVSEGFKGPVGDVYAFVESPRGELGFYLVSDGTNKPYRMKVRPP